MAINDNLKRELLHKPDSYSRDGKTAVTKGKKFPLNLHLRDARVDRGWSQELLAEKIGTTSINISRWENGSTFPNPYFRQRLAELFGQTPVELGLVPSSTSASGFKVFNVPFSSSPFFTGREPILDMLHKRISTSRRAALTQAQALTGMGGIGKTQIAVEYAYRYGDYYPHVIWMQAASRDTLVADCVALAGLLDLPEKAEQVQQQIVEAVKAWLATHEGWLLILDNADDLVLAQEFLPLRNQGYTLFTTRAQATARFAANIEVEQLTLQEGSLLLLRWTRSLDMDASLDQARAEERAVAERIVREMDGLPLAIVQAGAYVLETGCSLADYLSLYTTHRKELLARRSQLLLGYPETVATTWELSFQEIEQQSPVAADVLRFCALLSPDVIPEDLLVRGAAELGVRAGTVLADPFTFNQTLAVLLNYSLVRRNGHTHMLNIHRLVQAVLKESMDEETRCVWAERAVRAVNAAFPEDYDNPGVNLEHYLPHVQACASLIEEYHLYFPEAARLLFQAGVFLYIQGFYPQSYVLHQQALSINEQVFGSEHPVVAESLNSLALLSRYQGEYEQAERFHLQALAIREKALGPDHPATAQSLNNLGVIYRSQRKYKDAEHFFKRALILSEQSLGSEHIDTLFARLNLAKLYIEQGKYKSAEPLADHTLAISERFLGPEHHLIAQSLNLKARLSYERGDYEQAETLWKQALMIVEKTLGPEHPSMAERLNNLAELYSAQGRLIEAESLCRRAISICESKLGSEHPDTIIYRRHLVKIMSQKVAGHADNNHPSAPTGD